MKKIIKGILLAATAIVTIFSTITICEASAITAQEMARKFAELQQKYPEGKEWTGAYIVNGIAMSSQCMGWAETVCDYLFNENPRNWAQQTNWNNLCVGDHVRFPSSYGGHSIVITNISGDTVTYADCNYNVDDIVHWNKKMSLSTLKSTALWFKSQPDNWVRTLDGADTVNLGTDFYAVILNKSAWKPISVDDDGYIRLRKEVGRGYQVWKFTRESDGSYKIASAKNGNVIDVYDNGTSNYTPVLTYGDKGGTNQRWFIYSQGGGYVFVPKHAQSMALDLNEGYSTDGTTVQIYSRNNSNAQIFAVYNGSDVQIKSPSLSVSAGNSITDTTFSWNEVYGENEYVIKIWKNSVSGDPYVRKDSINTTSYKQTLPAGTYAAIVYAKNYFETKQSNTVTFTVTNPTYTVTFNPNGGTTSTTSKAVTYSSTYGTLPTPAKTGHTFSGWYTAASGGTKITADTKVSITANQTLYAQWTVNSYTLSVNPNGGTWTEKTSVQEFKMTYMATKAIPNPTRIGYQFVGWRINNGNGENFKMEPWGLALYKNADFSGTDYRFAVYNHRNNGAVQIERVAKSSDADGKTSGYMMKITISGTTHPGLGGFEQSTHSKSGGVFYHVITAKIPKGYSIEQGFNSCGDGAKSEWITPRDGTGEWETYVLRWNCGTTGSFSTFGYIYIHPTGMSAPWNKEVTTTEPISWYVSYAEVFDATDINQNGNTFTIGNGNAELLATWRANSYTVRYNANGGSGTTADSAHRYGSEKALTKNAFTKSFYSFTGWNTKPDGTGAAYPDEAKVQNLTAEQNGTVTLYAQWEKSAYTKSAVTSYGGYKLCNVKLYGISAPCTVILAAYKDGVLSGVQQREFTSDEETFALIGDFDSLKVMAWDNMKPLTEAEDIMP